MRGARRLQRGQAIVLIAVMLGVVVGMAALAIDGSRAYTLRRDLQGAVDAAALASSDSFQKTGNYATAEQAAVTSFSVNLRLYTAPACAPGYAAPGASSFTTTCTYSDGTKLVEVVSNLGPQGSQFAMTATRSLSLQFARVLTNGTTPSISSTSGGSVNNLLYAPALAALSQNGCGGAGGTAISINGSGTLPVIGDVVSSGAISVSGGSLRVAGDIYARCQGSVAGATNACYSSGASTPCTYPDIAGAIRSGYHFVDPKYPPPATGGSQGSPASIVTILPGSYPSLPLLLGDRCYFLAGGVYSWQVGYLNVGDLVSNELKPPDEPVVGNVTLRSPNQFWDADGAGCSGAVQVLIQSGGSTPPIGIWSFVVTSTRTETYSGTPYLRESAPSMCYQADVDPGQVVQVTVSNLPGATGYNIYAAPPGNGCSGPFGLAETLPVSVPVLNSNTNPCPAFNGNGCSLGHESITLNASDLGGAFAPSSLAAPDTTGAYPPNGESAPLAAGLPNLNPARGPGAAGDRANENNCDTIGGAFASCPAPITPGAVEFYLPSPSCMVRLGGADDYIFSGYQYNWISVYEPGAGSPPANTCGALLGASSNSAFVGLVYMPSAAFIGASPYLFESSGMGGVIADTITFTGSMPAIKFDPGYAPVPFASRLVS